MYVCMHVIKSPPKTNTKINKKDEEEDTKKLGGTPMFGCMFVRVFICRFRPDQTVQPAKPPNFSTIFFE